MTRTMPELTHPLVCRPCPMPSFPHHHSHHSLRPVPTPVIPAEAGIQKPPPIANPRKQDPSLPRESPALPSPFTPSEATVTPTPHQSSSPSVHPERSRRTAHPHHPRHSHTPTPAFPHRRESTAQTIPQPTLKNPATNPVIPAKAGIQETHPRDSVIHRPTTAPPHSPPPSPHPTPTTTSGPPALQSPP